MAMGIRGTDQHVATDSLVRMRPTSVLAALIVLVGGCSRYGTEEVTTSVNSDRESCVVTKQRISTGPVTFEIKNNGEDATSYDVRGEGDDGEFTEEVMSVRDVAAGEEATMSGTLDSGQYQVRCLLASGQTPAVTIRASVDGAAGPRVDLGPEKSFVFTVTRDDAVDPPPPMRAQPGDLVTFAIDNRSDRPIGLTVRGPDGEQAAAISADARTSPQTNVVLSSEGTYTVRVGQNGDRFAVEVAP